MCVCLVASGETLLRKRHLSKDLKEEGRSEPKVISRKSIPGRRNHTYKGSEARACLACQGLARRTVRPEQGSRGSSITQWGSHSAAPGRPVLEPQCCCPLPG